MKPRSKKIHHRTAERLDVAINNSPTRRTFLGDVFRVLGAVGMCGAGAWLALRRQGAADGGDAAQTAQRGELAPAGASGLSSVGKRYVWQIDPDLCMACGGCQKYCVLDVSAGKAVQCFALGG